jgi:hypothetical protein
LQQVDASLALVQVGLEQSTLVAVAMRPLLPLSAHRVVGSLMVEHLAGGVTVTVSGAAIHIFATPPMAPQMA